MRLVLASNNAHKLEEVRKILPREIEVLSLQQIGFHSDIEETGDTLEENSAIKAQAVWAYIQTHAGDTDGVFADDTGLEIRALGGKPGVHTARWAGEPANDVNNRKKVLRELEGVADRAARFRTVVTLIHDGKQEQMEGMVEGHIAREESGAGGFGYDPLFVPGGYDRTFADLPAEVKNSISHRARAMEKLSERLSVLHGISCQ